MRIHSLQRKSRVLLCREMVCSTETPLQSYPNYFSRDKQAEANEQRQRDSLHGLTQNECLSLQLGAQYPYQSYGLSLLQDKKYKPNGEMNLQEGGFVDYHVNQFQTSGVGFDTKIQNWASTSGSCGGAIFDEHSYHQVSSCNFFSLHSI